MRRIADIFNAYCERDANGRHIGGTDKQSNHRYGDAYESIFTDRDAVKIVMEIGVADGSSLLAWREVFQNAHIVGLDIHPPCRASGERMEFHLGSQTEKADCLRAAAGRQFDVIIEDAYHSLENTFKTLFFLWPSVKPGGMYIVEEWCNIGADRENIVALWPSVQIVDTQGPFGGVEPLVVFRKPVVSE